MSEFYFDVEKNIQYVFALCLFLQGRKLKCGPKCFPLNIYDKIFKQNNRKQRSTYIHDTHRSIYSPPGKNKTIEIDVNGKAKSIAGNKKSISSCDDSI